MRIVDFESVVTGCSRNTERLEVSNTPVFRSFSISSSNSVIASNDTSR